MAVAVATLASESVDSLQSPAMEVLLTVGDRYQPCYMGGHPSVPGPHKGAFIVTREKLGIAKTFRGVKWLAACPIASIERIEIGGGQVGKSKAGAVVMFGVLGLAAKGSKDRTDILVHLKDGYAAYFTIDAPVPMTKAYLLPTLQQLQIPVEVA
jgi:hypothetical protein